MVKDSKHLFSNVIDQKIQQIENAIKQIKEHIDIGNKMLEVLKEFKYNKEVQERIELFPGFGAATTATFTGV